MRSNALPPILTALVLATGQAYAQTAAPAGDQAAGKPAAKAVGEATADVKVGTGVDKFELAGAADSFEVAPGTRLYLWTRVAGLAAGADTPTVTLAFVKGGKTAFQIKLPVKHDPYRTFAYRTFRAGDSGDWTAKVLDADGKELGTADFKVTLTDQSPSK